MENLGEYLQQKREEQDISIEELVSRTRIPIRFIEAIEANHLDLLPNQVTAKGFLRSYAECVGVDHALISEAFSEYQTPGESLSSLSHRAEILAHVQVEKSNRLPFPRRIILAVAGLVFALLILVGLLSKKDKEVKVFSSVPSPQITASQRSVLPDASETPAISEEIPADEELDSEAVLPLAEDEEVLIKPEIVLNPGPSKEAVPESRSEDTEDVLAVEAPRETRPRVSDVSSRIDIAGDIKVSGNVGEAEVPLDLNVEAKEYVLFLQAIEPSWVQVTIDGEEIREALLQPDDVVEWKANKKFRLTLGNAGGVRVKLDGRELGPFGPSGEVVHKDILGESSVELN